MPNQYENSTVAALIVNSTSRRAASRGWMDALLAHLGPTHRVHVLRAASAHETTEAAREAACNGADIVIAGGGDGTVNAAAAGLSGSRGALGILPLGSANDLARELGVPRDPVRAAAHLAHASRTQVDLVAVNGRPFCTVGGIGLVATTTSLVASLKRGARPVRVAAALLRGSIYKLVSAGVLLSPASGARAFEMEYEAPDGERHVKRGRAHALLVANHRTLGGGMVLPVAASGRDGLFELCVVHERSRPVLLRDFAFLSAGLPLRDEALETVRVSRATIRCDAPSTFAADGELLAAGTSFEFEMRAGALTVLA